MPSNQTIATRGIPLEGHFPELLRYYDNLRQDVSLQVERQDGSNVLKVTTSNGTSTRLCHLTSLLPTTDGKAEKFNGPYGVYSEAMGLLAALHFNQRDTSIVPDLDRLSDCNVQFTIDFRDSRYSPIEGVRVLTQDIQEDPIAIVGAARSAVTGPLSLIAAVTRHLPVISYGSTSSALNDRTKYPYFGRTVPTNKGEAVAAASYFRNVLGVHHMGVLFIKDNFGSAFHAEFLFAARALDPPMIISSSPYDLEASDEEIERSCLVLKESGFKFFYGIVSPPSFTQVMRQAHKVGIAGHAGYTWLMAGGADYVTGEGKYYDADTEGDWASATNGMGLIAVHFDDKPGVDQAWDMLESNQAIKEYFLGQHHQSTNQRPVNFTGLDFAVHALTFWDYFQYDAVMALGIAACQAKEEFFTGPELFASLMNTSFQGASGMVQFDANTGTRRDDDVSYRITNVVARPPDQNNRIYFDNQPISVQVNNTWVHIPGSRDYIYADGTTNQPLAIPTLVVEENRIPNGLLIFGWILAALVCVASIALCLWVKANLTNPVVRASQPFFLIMICIGTFLMGASIALVGFQEPIEKYWLDFACMATPWLFSLGFVISFSGLFSKTMRVHRLMKSSQSFHRVVVSVWDVMVPFLVLGSINLCILTAWTVVAPLKWVRVPSSHSYDEYGRITESHGTCKAGDVILQRVFYFLFAGIIIAALLGANIANYWARDVSEKLHEASSINLSMAVMLEAFLIGVPAVLVVKDQPAVYFAVRTVLVTVFCGAILGPIFLPKILRIRSHRMSVLSAYTLTAAAPSSNGSLQVGGSVAAIRAKAAHTHCSSSEPLQHHEWHDQPGNTRIVSRK